MNGALGHGGQSLDEAEVLRRFTLYRGLTQMEAMPFLPLVRDAIAQVEELRRPGADGGDRQLCAAAAALAAWQSVLLESRGGFSAGELRVTPDDGKAAQAFWEQAKAAAAPWLRDTGFFFGRVR